MTCNKPTLLAVICLILLIISCKKSAIEQSKIDYEKFNTYITGYSQSPVSRCRDLFINLGFEVPSDLALPVDLFEISPPIGGTYLLNQSRNTISIINPEIKHNVSYTVKFNIGLLTEMPKGMETFSFPLEAQKQAWSIIMQAPVNKSMDYVTYKGEVNFAVCEPKLNIIEASLIAKQGNENLNILWDHKKDQKKSFFTINKIKRKDKPDKVNLNLNMEALNVNDNAKMDLAIPSKSDFSFHAFKLYNGNNKELKLTFTDPLLENQNLEGLIEVDGRTISQIKINNNQVNVYFKDEQFGYFDLKILPGIKNLAGYPLKDKYEKELFFNPPTPSVEIAERGNILPPGNKWELPISLISARGFRLRVLEVYDHNINRLYQENKNLYTSQVGLENLGRVTLDTTFTFDVKKPYLESFHSVSLNNVVRKESGALYKVLLSIPNIHSAYPCQEWKGNTGRDIVDAINFDQPSARFAYGYDHYDDYYYENNYSNLGGNHYSEEPNSGSPCYKNFETIIQDSRLLMCTDIGVVCKSEPDHSKYFFYTSKISSAAPIANARIALFNIQGKKLIEGQSNASGMANIQLKDQIPFLAKISHNDQSTYLELQDSKALSLSTFQVEGKNWNGNTKVFFFGERNVWRPGDTVYMNSIVFNQKNPIPASLPVQLKLFDPTNKLVKSWHEKQNFDGMYGLHFPTDINSPTGNWRLEMLLGGKTHRTPIRIETIRPNRLKMQMDFADDDILKTTDSKDAPVSVKWMHGLEAKELKTEVSMLQKSMKNPFSQDYKNYVFDNQYKRYTRERGIVSTGNTDKNGILDFTIPVEENIKYPSMMLFNFELRAFEKGGAFSTDMKAIKYSPYTHYVGAKFPGGDSNSEIYVKDTEAIMLAALNQNGKPENREVNIKLSELDHNWWYRFGNRGNYTALSNHTEREVKNYDIKIGKEGKAFSIDVFGRHLLEITDKKSGHSISRIIYSYGDRWNDNNEEVSQLEVLPFHIEQTEYEVGETLNFELPPMENGRYLITIESGGQIIHKEVRAGSPQPMQINIAISPEMTPNAYVHVHLIQAWKTHRNDRPLRLFGIKPIKVFDPNTILNPRIAMANELRTDEQFTVVVSEENNKELSYTLAIVDEGLLDITQFKTPDPWSAFFGKESLNVNTWDMYREIFQRFLGEYTSLLAVGGDGSNTIQASSKARRFKPVVKFVGPFKLGAGESKSHSFTINNYVGSVRAMIVGTNGKALGRYEKTVEVKKPLMGYTTLPRVLGPSESIKVPVTVFSMHKDIKNVQAKIITDEHVKVIGSNTQEVIFDKEGERDITFAIETKETTGIIEIELELKSGEYHFTEKIQLDLRPSSPAISKTYHNLIAANDTKELEYKSIGMQGTQSGKLSLSKGLNFSFAPQVEWLSNYPHGCLEQSISRIFPQIYLYKMNLLDEVDQMKYRQQFSAMIQKLRFLQMPDGGFSYWPGGNVANKWGTSYAYQFLIEAKNHGYNVPEDMLKKCTQFQYKSASSPFIQSNNNSRNYTNTETINQAYKLFTLAQAGKPNYAAMNRLRLSPNLHNTAKWLLAHSFLILNENDLADLMIESATMTTENYKELSGTFGSRLRDQAIIARVLLDKGEIAKAKRLIDEMVNTFNGDELRRLSTQDRAQALITFSKFVSSLGTTEDSVRYDIKLTRLYDQESKVLEFTPHNYSLDEAMLKDQFITISNKGNQDIYSTLMVKGIPLRDESKAEAQDLQLKVEYFADDGKSLDPKNINKGSDFTVQYTVIHEGVRASYENMALSAIFPSGWEIINQRMKEESSFNSGDVASYQDIRDDRVYLYFDINKGESKVFRFKMNATYAGKYWAPAAFCEAMYDASIRAKNEGFWANVK